VHHLSVPVVLGSIHRDEAIAEQPRRSHHFTPSLVMRKVLTMGREDESVSIWPDHKDYFSAERLRAKARTMLVVYLGYKWPWREGSAREG
jgi:hypothetical protein